jgi:hypothetical protein
MHALYNLADVKQLRIGHPQQIQVLMLVYSIITNDSTNETVLELTDFTSPFLTPISKFTVLRRSDAELAVKEIKEKYGSGSILTEGHLVLVNVIAEVSNHTFDFKYVASRIEIANDAESIGELTGDDKLHALKVKDLEQSLKTRGLWGKARNITELDAILRSIAKLDPESRELEEGISPVTKPINPLFTAPAVNHSQIPEYSQLELPHDSIATMPQEFVISSGSDAETDGDEEAATAQEANPMVEKMTNQIDSVIKEELYSNDDDDSSPKEIEQEQLVVKEVASENHQIIESPVLERNIPGSNKDSEDANNSLVITSSAEVPNGSKETSVCSEEPIQDEEEEEVEEETATNEGDSVIDDNPNGISSVLSTYDFELGAVIIFKGYIVGIEPFNVLPFGQSFNSLPNTTSFRILISNLKPVRDFVYSVNKNCIALEFRSKVKILKFFGYYQIESLVEDRRENLEKWKRFVAESQGRPKMFKIVKRKIGLSVGSEIVWECENSIDELLG